MCLQNKSFENTVGKGEIARNECSHSVFNPFGEPSTIFIKFEIVVCKLFQFVIWERVKHYVQNLQNVRLLDGIKKDIISLPYNKKIGLTLIESICRKQIKCDSKTEISLEKDRKHYGKRRKCWLPAFSPFPTMFSKDYFFRVVKSRNCVVEIIR